jgi:DHA1 family bicyclomycin/chloramphenicol resistance-like MFS transporter
MTRIRDALGLKGNILPILSIRSLDATGWQMFEAVWQPYILSLGASMQQVGVISSTYLAFFAGLQFFTGTVSDSLGRKRTMIIAYLLSLMSIFFTFVADSWIQIVPVMVIFAAVDALAEPAIIPLVAESVPEEKRGAAFGYLSQTWFLPGLFAPALGGLIGSLYGFKTVLTLVLVTETLSLILFHRYVKETILNLKPINLFEQAGRFFELVKPEAGFIRLYATIISNRFAYALFDGVLYAMVIKAYGFNVLTIALAANIFTMTTAVCLFGTGRIVDKVGSRIPIIVSNLSWILALVLYFYSHELYMLLLAQMVRGISVALWDPALNTYVASETTESDRGRITGKVGALKGILTFPAPVLGATLFELYGLTGPIALSMVGILVSSGLALGLRKE